MEKRGTMSNRNRNQYGKQNFQKNAGLPWNTHGIFFTCEYEKSAVREAQNIISKYLDEPSVSQRSNKDEELDVADLLQKEVEESKKPKISMRIRQLPTGIKHSLFFGVAELPREKLVPFVSKIVDDSQVNQQCRFLLRAVPIEDISSDEYPMLPNKLRRILEYHYTQFASDPENKNRHPTFAVDFKVTFGSFKRQAALDLVCETVKDINPESSVNLSQPDFAIIFHVVKKAVLLSCVRDFNKRRKFSLRPPGTEEKKSEPQKTPQESTE
ncbi:hypothetical protein FO519_008011 [Halicephalobus sp. NKZ332]|nr:hypothetical protein FO519_008011 [Halicephalobus sp. NKZ332]